MNIQDPTGEDIASIVRLREGGISDRAYIIRTWLATYSHSAMARSMKESYFRSYSKIVERQLARSQVRVACLAEDPAVILGFAALNLNQGLVHFVAVREKWRRKGIAKMLLKDELKRTDLTFTHTPPRYMEGKIIRGWVFSPLYGAGLETDR